MPLFSVESLAWKVPDAASFDALLLTSANAVRQAGAGLTQLRGLPVHAVGAATATAARSTKPTASNGRRATPLPFSKKVQTRNRPTRPIGMLMKKIQCHEA